MTKADSDFQLEVSLFQSQVEESKNESWEYGSASEMNLTDVKNICSLILEKIIVYNESNFKKQWKNTLNKFMVFHCDEFPLYLNIKEYIHRLIHYINCDQHVLILAMMNLDKFLELNSEFVLTKSNCYR